jgi:hypothetical protein
VVLPAREFFGGAVGEDQSRRWGEARLSTHGTCAGVREQARMEQGDPRCHAGGVLPRPCRQPLAERARVSRNKRDVLARNGGHDQKPSSRRAAAEDSPPSLSVREAAASEFEELERMRGKLEVAETEEEVSRLVTELAAMGITFNVDGN